MFMVFSLSFNTNQAKNLILGIHLDFQIQMTAGWGATLAK